jgi:septal ring factor EnvC (AmiA/AmiB activator)
MLDSASQRIIVEVSTLEKLIKAFHSEIAAIRSDMNDALSVERRIADHKKSIAWHEKQIAEIEYRRDNGPDMIAHIQAELQILRRKHNTLRHNGHVDKLLKLVAQMRELERAGIQE